MSDESTPPPGPDAGIESLRLDADRTRDELSDTLDAIEQRLRPRGLLDSLSRQWREKPVETALIAAAPFLLIGAIVTVSTLVGRRRG